MSGRDHEKELAGDEKHVRAGIPNMRAIRGLSIIEVAEALKLQFGSNGHIHCWHPERHQHGDRTASVGIQKKQNRVKCFGCDSPLMGPLDLAMDVLELKPKDAALWIAERFEVPRIPPRKHLKEPQRIIHTAGFETASGLLIRSGLWTKLSPSTQRLVPVLLELANFSATAASEEREKSIHLSYRALGRFTGSSAGRTSPSTLSKGLSELEEIGWLRRDHSAGTLLRRVSRYVLTPFSDSVRQSANATAAELRADVAVEKELRTLERQRRRNAIVTAASAIKTTQQQKQGGHDITQYNSLFDYSSGEPFDDSMGEARSTQHPPTDNPGGAA